MKRYLTLLKKRSDGITRLRGLCKSDISELGFYNYIIFRPGLLLRKDTDREGERERISAALVSLLKWVGIIKKIKPVPTAILAEIRTIKLPHKIKIY